ncbi:NmrA family NAD(P)-binding protein [Demequina sp. NBRC 110056]|uniref:NmrA family NAD(P)-binding protein n=1 Tax=Demequina sp. NBRC 110056 TaxID=1570345 RepID=UPI0013564726|nr:NmrA family NAD(P)-binding protein [Demequina sp. NBRC 110056]
MDTPILVTGATGNIGRAIVGFLRAEGAPVRAAARSPRDVTTALGDEVEAVALDFTDPTTWDGAFRGVERMFLMRPPQLSNIARDMVPALEAAKSAGVRHMVLLSLQGAESNTVVPHARIEAWLRDSGLEWTFVRPSFFMENLTTTHLTDIRDRDSLMVPAGTGATSFVAASDVAAVASAALLDPSAHRNTAWTPTGTSALTYAEVADTLSHLLGRPIRYAKPGVIAYARHARRTLGMPWGMVAVTTAIYSVARAGKADGITDDVLAVTGQPPQSFEQWATQHAGEWSRP